MTAPAAEASAAHEAIRRRVQDDVAATERRIAELRDEIAGHERHLADIRLFEAMLVGYAGTPTSAPAPSPDGGAAAAPEPAPAPPAPPAAAADGDARALREAIRARLPAWNAWIDQSDDRDRPPPRRSDMSYAVLSMCQCLCIAETGEAVGEDTAVEWALAGFEEPWCRTVERSLMWRGDPTVDEAANAEARRFVRWAVARALEDPA